MLSPNRSTRRPFHPRMALPRTVGVAKWMIDFGDLSTMYADSAGTTPAAIEGTLGKILDKSGAGNHFVQTDAAKRLKVSALVNLLIGTEALATQTVVTRATTQTLRFTGTGTITLSGTATSGALSAGTHSIVTTAGNLTLTVAGTVTKADLRPANSGAKLPVYQRVNTATDYDTVGFPVHLKQNATNTAFLVSAATIDCSGTDAMTVFWGGRKLSDAALGTVYASSATPASTNGAFRLSAPGANGENTYLVTSRGTWLTDALASSRVAPLSNVVTMTSDISGDFIKLRVNGALIDTDTGDQGTGNYANESMYIGMQGVTLLPFTGHLHSLIGCGALLSDYAMRKIEDWQAGQMRITL